MAAILQYKLYFRLIRFLLSMFSAFLFVANTYAGIPLNVNSRIYFKDSLDVSRKITFPKKKNFFRAAGEVFGMNMGLWAFDRYALKGHYAYISFETIKENFKHGFEWDNDHLNTNMFAHPYNGSLFFQCRKIEWL